MLQVECSVEFFILCHVFGGFYKFEPRQSHAARNTTVGVSRHAILCRRFVWKYDITVEFIFGVF